MYLGDIVDRVFKNKIGWNHLGSKNIDRRLKSFNGLLRYSII